MAKENNVKYNSNYKNLFESYKGNFKNQINSNNETIEKLNSQILSIDKNLESLNKNLPTFDDRKSSEYLPKLNKTKQELEDTQKSHKVLSKAESINLKKSFASKKEKIEKLTTQLKELSQANENNSNNTNSERTEIIKNIDSLRREAYKIYEKLAEDDKNKEIIQKKQAKVDAEQAKYDAIVKDEKSKYRANNKINNQNKSDSQKLTQAKRQLKNRVFKLNKENEELSTKLNNVQSNSKENFEDFKKFLTDKGFQTTHAEELYQFFLNNDKSLGINKDNFKIRKQHPVRDAILKKFVVPVALTAGAVSIVFGSASSLVYTAGADKFLFLTMSTNLGTNISKFSLIGAAVGAVGASGTILTKNAITKNHYKKEYGNVEKILNDPKSAKFDKLLTLVQDRTDEILDLRSGNNNLFSKIARGIDRTNKNIINRNRIHHIESIAEKLLDKFNEINNNEDYDDATKAELLQPICKKLNQINDCFTKDIEKSKVFALLNCKDTQKGHTHKETIENIDIYAKLNMYIENACATNLSNREKSQLHKKIRLNTTKQQNVAYDLLNNQTSVIDTPLKIYNNYLEALGLSNSKDFKLENTANSNNKVIEIPAESVHTSVNTSKANLKETEISNIFNTSIDLDKNNYENTESTVYGDSFEINISNAENDVKTKTKQGVHTAIAADYTILSQLKDEKTIQYLTDELGYSENDIQNFEHDLTRTKYTSTGKKRSTPISFRGTKIYKNTPTYEDIYIAINQVIKSPKLLNDKKQKNVENLTNLG